MELWVLDENLKKMDLVENYLSFIWTERYDEPGEVQLRLPYGQNSRTGLLQVGRYLWNDESNKLMKILTHQNTSLTGGSGDDSVLVTGKSLEHIVNQRVLLPNTSEGYWEKTGTAGRIVTRMVIDVLEGDNQSSLDGIPRLTIYYPEDEGQEISVQSRPQILYSAMKPLLAEEDLGFNLRFDYHTKDFTFQVHRGVERDNMLFSPDFDNLTNVRYLRSIEDYKNVAYVYHKDAPVMVVSRSGTHFEGFDRRVMYVDASSIDNPTATALRQEGKAALAETDKVNLVEGEALPSLYIYNGNYRLGDRVRIRNQLGVTTPARVVEYVWSHDAEGLKEYPTFKTIE